MVRPNRAYCVYSISTVYIHLYTVQGFSRLDSRKAHPPQRCAIGDGCKLHIRTCEGVGRCKLPIRNNGACHNTAARERAARHPSYRIRNNDFHESLSLSRLRLGRPRGAKVAPDVMVRPDRAYCVYSISTVYIHLYTVQGFSRLNSRKAHPPRRCAIGDGCKLHIRTCEGVGRCKLPIRNNGACHNTAARERAARHPSYRPPRQRRAQPAPLCVICTRPQLHIKPGASQLPWRRRACRSCRSSRQ